MAKRAMNDAILKAMIYAMTKEVANGRPIIDMPHDVEGDGPCPNCAARIEISGFTFSEGNERADNRRAALIVCASCEKVLMSDTPGKFEVMPRASVRKLPRVSRKFIERSLELIHSIKKHVN